MGTKSKSIRCAAFIALAVFIASVGAGCLSYGLIVGGDFSLVWDAPEFGRSMRAQTMTGQALEWAWQLHYTAADPVSERHDAFKANLTYPRPFYYHVQEMAMSATTNVTIPAGETVETFFRQLPLYDSFTFEKMRLVAYVGLAEPAFRELATAYYAERERVFQAFYFVVGGVVLLLLGAVSYAVATWHATDVTLPHKLLWKYIPLDLALGALLGLSLFGARLMVASRELYQGTKLEEPLLVGSAIGIGLTLLGLLWVNMTVQRLKHGKFWRHTLVGTVLLWGLRLFPMLWELRLFSKNAVTMQAVLFVVYAGASAFLVLALANIGTVLTAVIAFGLLVAINVVATLYVVSHAKAVENMVLGTAAIRRGETAYFAPTKWHKDINALAAHVNDIVAGLERAIASRMKAERLKIDLITNVSHDLKTPLTSLITYIDLLRREGLSAESAPRYLEILAQKSERLRILTNDLIEAATVASGSVAVNWEEIHVPSLVEQGLGELSDRIAAKQLDFRVTADGEPLHVRAEGKLLWRAVENVLTNVLKYTVPASRVYVDMVSVGNSVRLTIKNVSALPLNIPPEELLERFVRGDEARSSEGSGLGLSIAKSLVELQQGTLEIEIDGDLFKVIITLPRLC